MPGGSRENSQASKASGGNSSHVKVHNSNIEGSNNRASGNVVYTAGSN